MGAFEDITHELKTAKPPEKALIIGGVIAVAGVAIYLYTHQAAPSQTSQGTQSSTSGNQTPFPTIQSGQVPVLPYGTNPVYDPNGNLVGYQGSPTTPSTPTAPSNPTFFVRGKGSQSAVSSYDVKYSGIPIRSQPGGSVIGTAPYGSQLSILSGPIQGPSNIGPGKGSNIWYQTSSGYVSQFDVVPSNPSQPKPGGGVYGTGVLSPSMSRVAPSHERQPNYLGKTYARSKVRYAR